MAIVVAIMSLYIFSRTASWFEETCVNKYLEELLNSSRNQNTTLSMAQRKTVGIPSQVR